jgi:RND family efflux transporter MFP subunit
MNSLSRSLVNGVLLGVFAFALPAHAADIATAKVRIRSVAAQTSLDGVIEAVKQSTVSSQASGRIVSLMVKAGDKVRAGQVLATVDDREAQTGVQASQAQLRQAEADLHNAKANFERTRDLQAQGFFSKAALDAAEAQFKMASGRSAQAAAGAQSASLAQGFTRVTAPFDGWVAQTFAEAGDLAVPGKPLVSVYAPQAMRAVLQVPASRSALVRAAQSVSVLLPGETGAGLTPVARTEVPSTDPVSQTSEWRFDLPQKSGMVLVPGQQVRVQFQTASAGAAQQMVIPSSAVVRRGELTGVYVASGQAFVLRAVRLAPAPAQGADSSWVQVLSGLTAQDAVALDPLRAAQAR